jgi:hypothetical protein
MSDWAVLILVAYGLYLLECVTWIEAAAAACVRGAAGGRWRLTYGRDLIGNERGGFAFADPASVRGALVICQAWPISMSPDGITDTTVSGEPDRAPSRHIRFDDIRDLRAVAGDVHVNGDRFVSVGSPVAALHLVEQIRRIQRAPAVQRGREVRDIIAHAVDTKKCTAAWARFAARTRLVAACSSTHFVFTLIVCPMALAVLGPPASWRYLLAGLVAITLATGVAYFRTHRSLYPACAADRWVHTISMVLLPVAAIRCMDKLSRDALSEYDAAAVAATLCEPDAAVSFLRRRLVDLYAPSAAGAPTTSASECAAWFRQTLATETEKALGPLRTAALKPPSREDDTIGSYCPRCHAQFIKGRTGDCPECPGIELAEFARD